MDDLTRQAINEIVRDMHEQQEAEKEFYKVPSERKKNPIGPNKRFLGRTISDMNSHNKRADERTQRNCARKLAELDRKWEKRKRKKRKHSPISSSSSPLIISSPSHKRSKKKRTKKLKKKKKSSSSSSDSTTSSTDGGDVEKRKRKYKVKKKRNKTSHDSTSAEEVERPISPRSNGYAHTAVPGHYLDPYAMATFAFNHMQHMLQLEAFMASSANGSVQSVVKRKSSDSEQYENGILTFDVSSGEEIHKKKKKEASISEAESDLGIASELNLSCGSSSETEVKNPPPSPHIVATISLDSDENLDKSNNDITVLLSSSSSSSSSESDKEHGGNVTLANRVSNGQKAVAEILKESNEETATVTTNSCQENGQHLNSSIVILTSSSESESETVDSKEQSKEAVNDNNSSNIAIDLT